MQTCTTCNSELLEDVHFCGNCGQKVGATQRTTPPVLQNDEDAEYRYAIPIRRVMAFTVISFGLYMFYWFYITWKQYRDHTGEKAFPFWHAMTQLVPFYSLYRVHAHIRVFRNLGFQELIDTNLSAVWAVRMILISQLPYWISLVSFIATGLHPAVHLPQTIKEYLIWSAIDIAGVIVLVFALTRFQEGINRYWEKVLPRNSLYKEIGIFEVLITIVGGLLWIGLLGGIFTLAETDNVNSEAVYSKEIQIGDCLDYAGWYVDCETVRYAIGGTFTTTNYVVLAVKKLDEDDGPLNYEEKNRYRSRMMRADSNCTEVFLPTHTSWAEGDRWIKCAAPLE